MTAASPRARRLTACPPPHHMPANSPRDPPRPHRHGAPPTGLAAPV